MGFVEIATALLAHEHTLIDAQDMSHSTPLHVSAFAGNEHLTALLLKWANPMQRTCRNTCCTGDLGRARGCDARAARKRRACRRGRHRRLDAAAPCRSLGADGRGSAQHCGAAALIWCRRQEAKPSRRHRELARAVSGPAAARQPSGASEQRQCGSHEPIICAAAGSDRSPAAEGAAAASATALANSKDDFSFVLGCLQSPGLRRVLEAFHSSHHYKFRRLHGGDFPLELTALHSQFHGLVARHVERLLGTRGLTWDRAAAACERAVYEGRCSKERLRLLQQLSALHDFEAFFSLMSSASPPRMEEEEEEDEEEEGVAHELPPYQETADALSSSCRRVMLGTRMFERMR